MSDRIAPFVAAMRAAIFTFQCTGQTTHFNVCPSRPGVTIYVTRIYAATYNGAPMDNEFIVSIGIKLAQRPGFRQLTSVAYNILIKDDEIAETAKVFRGIARRAWKQREWRRQ